MRSTRTSSHSSEVDVRGRGGKRAASPLSQSRSQSCCQDLKTMQATQKHHQILAGVSVPDTELVASALAYARRACEPYLFNHVVRSWLFAARLGQIRKLEHDEEVVAVGTLLHD